jgi:hypothetical protein
MKPINTIGLITMILGVLFLSSYIFFRYDSIQLPSGYFIGIIIVGLVIFYAGVTMVFEKRGK